MLVLIGSSASLSDVARWFMLTSRDCFGPYMEESAKSAEKCEARNAIADKIASDLKVEKWLKECPENACYFKKCQQC